MHAQLRVADLPEGPAARLNFSQTGFGLKLQLDLTIADDIDVSGIERELVSALLLELMYRNAPDTPAGTPYVQPPPWLVDGMLGLAAAQNSSMQPNAAALAIAQNNIAPLSEFLRQQPELLEASPRAVYRAHAAAFVSMLLTLPDGSVRLQKFVADLPHAGDDQVAQLEAHFTELAGHPKALQALWTNALTRLAARDRYRMLSCEETERQLSSALTVEVQAGKARADACALEQFPQFIGRPQTPEALRRLRERLSLLSARANPLYAAIIGEYGQIAQRLSRRKTGKISERLARLRTARDEISRRMTAIDDYMNWFEATQSRAPSDAFADYMKAAELSAETQPRRRDAISVYLDALEVQLQN